MKSACPRIALLHYTAPPVVGGVETVLAQQARLFTAAGYPTTVIVGRGGSSGLPDSAGVAVIPEMDSGYPENVIIATALDHGATSMAFLMLQDRIEKALSQALAQVEVVIAHNIMTTHFNLPLTAALHRLADQGIIRRLIVWCHDVSRHVNPASGATLRFGFPWSLLRTGRSDFTYVTVSTRCQQQLAKVFGYTPQRIHVVPNGVDPALLLGLSDLGQHLADEFGLLSADLIILMPVRITRAKNIEYALQVTAALKAAGLNPRLVVTGPPDPHGLDIEAYYVELQTLRRALTLEAEAIFVYEGTRHYPLPLTLSPQVIAELYRLCDLVLMPSHREGFGLPVLEAGVADKPIFTTAIPAAIDLGGGFEHLIQANESPEAVAARIRAWAEQDVVHRLRRRFRRTYTWSSIFARHVEPLIRHTVKSPAGRLAGDASVVPGH